MVRSVVAVEEDAALAAAAKAALKGTNAKLVEGPLAKGYKKGAPYDLILIDGAVELISDALVDQLAERGRLVAASIDNGVAGSQIGRRAGGGGGTGARADGADAVPPGV